ncbi:monofunctional biosynthetic peptidoglycan transglycosylase [Bdellovibrio bacteriovorus]|uniref:monofunctional biosynthetic peptidoglycan transglycosylase n=1 Tax=Bdellovibrio bacteriovorus TaxID=959 RepID=UPI0021D07189|nr:monofunctional biosynthetic peptidoglycan transglycosylase [Bdellovibrio bacteriovorus]UXR65611.1 monofunctional biosynthetic peptidoglycan transglycosylase [Bdellovibrio bacteriovorus]
MKQVFFFFLGVFCLMALAVGALWTWLPSQSEIKGCLVTRMYQVELCPGSKNYVPLKQVAPILAKTIILTEDSNFYNHKGFDWDAIEKNAKEGWETGVFKRGGSTITQQLAKNMFLTKDRTFIRKGLEAIITDRIEHTLTKKEILERYLNVVEFGKDIYGVKAAAKYYFKKSPAELSVVESAFLAMVLPNPVKYSMSYYRKELTPFARKRLSRIVEDLYRYHRISEEEYNVAAAQVAYFFQPEPPPEEIFADGEQVPTLQELENMESQEQMDLEEESE